MRARHGRSQSLGALAARACAAHAAASRGRAARHGGGRGRGCARLRLRPHRGRRGDTGLLFRHAARLRPQRQVRRGHLRRRAVLPRQRGKSTRSARRRVWHRAADALCARCGRGARDCRRREQGAHRPHPRPPRRSVQQPVHARAHWRRQPLCRGPGTRGTSIRHACLGNPRHVCQLRVRVLLPATVRNAHERPRVGECLLRAAPGVSDRSAHPPSVSRARGDGQGMGQRVHADGVCGLALRHDAAEAPRGAAPGADGRFQRLPVSGRAPKSRLADGLLRGRVGGGAVARRGAKAAEQHVELGLPPRPGRAQPARASACVGTDALLRLRDVARQLRRPNLRRVTPQPHAADGLGEWHVVPGHRRVERRG